VNSPTAAQTVERMRVVEGSGGDADSRCMNADLSLLKKQIVKATLAVGAAHIPSAFSILDILWVLYDRVLTFDPTNPGSDNRDRFILSKGHGSLALYAVLAEKGFFPATELQGFATSGSRLGGHPDWRKVPGVEASTGSLGHGLPIAVGIAMGMRIRQNPRRVFVLVGDGECNEGSIWESSLLAAHHNLSSLTCIVDFNHSTDRALGLGNLARKFSAFGWRAIRVPGHHQERLFQALTSIDAKKPTAIIAHTIKGRGYRPMENNPAWHHASVKPEELSEVLKGIR
jgi:transketolase